MLSKSIIAITLVTIALAYGGFQKHKFNPKSNPVDKMVLNAAIKEVSIQTNSIDQQYLRVLDCQTKLVSGFFYKFHIEFMLPNQKVQTYFIQLYIVPWQNKIEVKEFKQMENIDGNNKKAFDANDQIFNALQQAEDGVPEQVDSNSLTSDQKQMVAACQKKIANTVNGLIGNPVSASLVSEQVVSGEEFIFQINYENVEMNTARSFDCHVWSQPWLNPPFTVQSVEDHVPLEMLRQDGASKQIEFNPESDSIEQQMAWTSLINYLENNINGVNLQNILVVKATEQVVAGLMYSLTIQFRVNGQLHSAQAKIFVQAWKQSAQVVQFINY